jgi:hypothetical protein
MNFYGSEHYPIMVAKPVAEAVDDYGRWRLTGADWSSFRDLCCSELRFTALEGSSNSFSQFTLTLIKIAEKMIPKTRSKLKVQQNPWFNEDCKSAARNRRAAPKNSRETFRNQTLNELESFEQKLVELSENRRETAAGCIYQN